MAKKVGGEGADAGKEARRVERQKQGGRRGSWWTASRICIRRKWLKMRGVETGSSREVRSPQGERGDLTPKARPSIAVAA